MDVVTLDEAKAHLNITNDDDDEEIQQTIDAAVANAEAFLGGALVAKSVTSRLPGGGPIIYLPYRPVLSVESVVDQFGGATIQLADFWIDTFVGRLAVNPVSTGYFPIDGTYTYTTGWPTPIPVDIRDGVLELIRHKWESQRGQASFRPTFAGGGNDATRITEVEGFSVGFPDRVKESLGPHRLLIV